jgi:hypothetical protein
MPCFRQLRYRLNPLLAKKGVEFTNAVFATPDTIDLLCIAIADAEIHHIRVEALHIGTVKRAARRRELDKLLALATVQSVAGVRKARRVANSDTASPITSTKNAR